jgi:uncharacterized caspase-like protein
MYIFMIITRFFFTLSLLLSTSTLQAAKLPPPSSERLALVIGNKDYPHKPLINPINDARDIKATLEQIGFRVIYRENATLADMDSAVRSFVSSLNKNSVAVVYYSGHGAQADGANYLIPIGANIGSKAELKSRAYDAGIILAEMQDIGNSINIVILDACRNNPFKGARGGIDGMASMTGPKGSLIAYATAPDSVADDNTSARNGLYTSYLKKYLLQPGLTVESMFKKVREGVLSENPEQVPWETSSIIGDFCFAGCRPLSPALYSQDSVDSGEAKYWDSILASNNPADFQAYLSRYPQGRFTTLARNRMLQFNNNVAQSCTYCPEMAPLPIGILMGKYEVTQGQWRAIMGNNPSKFKNCGDDCSVENVSWQDVQTYIQRLNQQSGKHYRLPSEEEWLIACLAGGNGEFCGSGNIDSIAWYRGNSSFGLHPVGKKQGNAWNLFDMSGNVWEWTASCEGNDCTRHYIRGGSWDGETSFLRSDVRIRGATSEHYYNIGFRVAEDKQATQYN